MKKILFPMFLIAGMGSEAAIIRWDGEGANGLWNTAANWDGNTVPGAMDDVVLDHSIRPTTYSVSLPPGNITVTIRSLTITSAGTNLITLFLPLTNTANPGLRVTGAGDALVLNYNAVLRNISGASAGSGIVIENVFRINNNAKYIHNTQCVSDPIVEKLSAAAGTELGIFEFNVPQGPYALSVSDRTYGTLVLSSSAYTGSGTGPLHIRGDLRINNGASLKLGMAGDCIIHQNLFNAALFDLQTSSANNLVRVQGNLLNENAIIESGSGFPVLQMNGPVNQNIIGGAITGSITFSINNPAGITLQAPLILPYSLQFISGKIRTSATALLSLMDNAIHTGSSANSFVEGPMKKTGDEDFYFPVGKGSIYAPVGLGSQSGATAADEFVVEYVRSNPQAIYGTDYETAINHISYTEYWTIKGNTGTTASRYLTLPVNCESFCRNIDSVFVARYDTASLQWRHAGRTGSTSSAPAACPGYQAGTVTSGPVSGFRAFTLATGQQWDDNPLPVDLIRFNAIRADQKAILSWQISCCELLDFEIQRAGEDGRFYTIGNIRGAPNKFFYEFEDFFLSRGTNYYRLKLIDNQMFVKYSHTVSLVNEVSTSQIISLLSTVVSSELKMRIVSFSARPIKIVIIDVQGRPVRVQHRYLQTGTTTLTLLLTDLHQGIYYLFGESEQERTNVLPFFKN